MPSGRDWIELLKSTFHRVGKADLTGLFSREWQHAKHKLTAADRRALAVYVSSLPALPSEPHDRHPSR